MDFLVMLEEGVDLSPVLARVDSVPSAFSQERCDRDVVTLYGVPKTESLALALAAAVESHRTGVGPGTFRHLGLLVGRGAVGDAAWRDNTTGEIVTRDLDIPLDVLTATAQHLVAHFGAKLQRLVAGLSMPDWPEGARRAILDHSGPRHRAHAGSHREDRERARHLPRDRTGWPLNSRETNELSQSERRMNGSASALPFVHPGVALRAPSGVHRTAAVTSRMTHCIALLARAAASSRRSARRLALLHAPALSQSPLAGLDDYVARGVKDWNVPGLAIAVVKDDSVVFAKGYGVRKLGTQDSVNAHTLFANASTTKAFTSFVVELMADEGKLRMDAPVMTYLPAFRLADPVATRQITIADLLSHRTGVPEADYIWYKDTSSFTEIMRRLSYVPLNAPVRSHFEYQNITYALAGNIAAERAGTTWEKLVQRRAFSRRSACARPSPARRTRRRTRTLPSRTTT